MIGSAGRFVVGSSVLCFVSLISVPSAKAGEPLEGFLHGMLEGCEYTESHWDFLRSIANPHFEGSPLIYPDVAGVTFGELKVEDDDGLITLTVPVMSMWRGLLVTHIGLEAMWETGVHVSTVTFGQSEDQALAVLGADVARSNKLIQEWDDLDGGFSAGITAHRGRGVLYCDLST
ncbi:hypothetical protein JHC09_00745 [Devosia sp. MC532]|uniref:hypothetical protein n=1 Tax=Devosia sp. MC532 TaxID=2799788 RepID=UPI0018F5CAA1|nr:hypothetical protein [Devosia sp. MC532]MBJ7576413.1 hypothetical protein [Devosia sp. MC532]